MDALWPRWIAGSLLIWMSVSGQALAAGKPEITVTQAVLSGSDLSIDGQLKNSNQTHVAVYDSSGRLLGQAAVDDAKRFSLTRSGIERPELLCSISAKTGDASISAQVQGRDESCVKAPNCKIITPQGSLQVLANTDIAFKAKASLKDKSAKPLRMEWDFGGGSMGQELKKAKPVTHLRPNKSGATVKFVRDNGRYLVRFMAWDRQQRYCEDFVEVVVGTPPDSNADFQSARAAVEQMAGVSQDAAPTFPLAEAAGRVVLPFEEWTMQHITDARTAPNLPTPYGPQVNSINAVVYEKARQPVPLGPDAVKLTYSAASNKLDPVGPLSINSTSQNWPTTSPLLGATLQKSDFFETWTLPTDANGWSFITQAATTMWGTSPIPGVADEGYHNAEYLPDLNPGHGRYMPGIADPYAANDAQDFSAFVANENGFTARMLPVTDIDDLGRVNPYPLFRVQASDLISGDKQATDMVLTASRDLHCRECHAKGGLGARAGSSVHHHDHSGHNGSGGAIEFFEPASDSLFDQEYAAMRNVMAIHGRPDFKDGSLADTCASSNCHKSALAIVPFGKPFGSQETSVRVHAFHGRLQYDKTGKDIRRNKDGLALAFDPGQWNPKTGSYRNSLFPVKDAKGKLLPMEQNCLRCHAGMREQCYRDRMYSAGVTCYQCHGDMLAVGGAFPKSAFARDGRDHREAWFDEPDCASCHTGNGNRGKPGKQGFFSAGVMRTAFDEADRSATPRQPDLFNPDERRFAVVPDTQVTFAEGSSWPESLDVPLYRSGKDRHGQVPCSACHGAAHAIWPNRDPKANDNVTANQLQGHAGPIAECKVCHTPNSFARFEDLDEGQKPADAKLNVLGGPHNMHPVDDPNWWQQAAADTTPNDSTGHIAGGWHNDYAKLPGAAGEDQCAACHGNDHRGTRLSRTPVDRQFVDENGKTFLVKAGTAIGCDLCHSIERSCTGSPALPACGKASDRVAGTTNRPPTFTSQPPASMLIGEVYRYEAAATDPEGDAIAYTVAKTPVGDIAVDPQTGVLEVAAGTLSLLDNQRHELASPAGHYPPYLLDFRLIATDSHGAYSIQPVRVGVDCPGVLVWDRTEHVCAPIAIDSSYTTYGLNEGETYVYQVHADFRSGQKTTFSLQNAPESMRIDAKTGLIKWIASPDFGQRLDFAVAVTDSQGNSATQAVFLMVCAKPETWQIRQFTCASPIAIRTQPTINGLNVGDTYDYQPTVTHSQGLALTYSLDQAPTGMTVNKATGTVHWVAQADATTSVYPRLAVTDSTGYTVYQELTMSVCAGSDRWQADSSQCHGPITFTSESPVYGLVAGETYTYAVTATHRDGLAIGFGLANAPSGMTIDKNTGVINWVAASSPDGNVAFSIVASDAQGASASQEIGLTVCESGMRWDPAVGCQGPVLIEPQTIFGVDEGTTFNYPVIATLAGGGPIGFDLTDAPAGMAIDHVTGVITWLATFDQTAPNPLGFTVIASDEQGRQTLQYGYVTVCPSPQHWNNTSLSCEAQ